MINDDFGEAHKKITSSGGEDGSSDSGGENPPPPPPDDDDDDFERGMGREIGYSPKSQLEREIENARLAVSEAREQEKREKTQSVEFQKATEEINLRHKERMEEIEKSAFDQETREHHQAVADAIRNTEMRGLTRSLDRGRDFGR